MPAGKHGAAERVRSGFQHRSRRREVVRKTVVDEIATPKARGEQRPRQAPVVRRRDLRARRSDRVTRRRASRRPSALRRGRRTDGPLSADRAVPTCASPAAARAPRRVVIAAASTPARMRANAGAWAFACAICRGNCASCSRSRTPDRVSPAYRNARPCQGLATGVGFVSANRRQEIDRSATWIAVAAKRGVRRGARARGERRVHETYTSEAGRPATKHHAAICGH